MSKQDQQGWKSMEFNMTTAPSVGRFSNDQQPTLYVKGSSAKFDDNDGRKTMAPYSNHGQLSHQASQQSASDIVDLRTALGANSWPQLGYYLVPDGWGYPHKSIAIYETSEADSPEVIIQRHSQLIEEFVVNSCEALFVVQSRLSGETPVVS